MMQAQRMSTALQEQYDRGVAAGKQAAAKSVGPLLEAVRQEMRNAHPRWAPTPNFAIAWADLQTELAVLRGDIA